MKTYDLSYQHLGSHFTEDAEICALLSRMPCFIENVHFSCVTTTVTQYHTKPFKQVMVVFRTVSKVFEQKRDLSVTTNTFRLQNVGPFNELGILKTRRPWPFQ